MRVGWPQDLVDATWLEKNRRATKVAVGIIFEEDDETPGEMNHWSSEKGDIRRDAAVFEAMFRLIQSRRTTMPNVGNRHPVLWIGLPQSELPRGDSKPKQIESIIVLGMQRPS